MIVDIHNHILPRFDDGAQTETEAMELLRNAAENGITHVITTPHHQDGTYNQISAKIKDTVEQLNFEVEALGIPIKVFAGMEIHLTGDILKDRYTNLIPLAGKNYLLIEMPHSHIPHFTEEVFYDMQINGYIPIIAHAERNREIRKHPNRLIELVQKGALVQVTASSVTGFRGRDLQKFSLKLLKHNLVHFIASDAHHITKRPFLLQSAYQYIRKHHSADMVDYLQRNAVCVLNGEEFNSLESIKFERKKKRILL